MAAKELGFDVEARSQLKSGVDQLAKAVKVTLRIIHWLIILAGVIVALIFGVLVYRFNIPLVVMTLIMVPVVFADDLSTAVIRVLDKEDKIGVEGVRLELGPGRVDEESGAKIDGLGLPTGWQACAEVVAATDDWRERLAVAIGMWPRGEVGAGILVLSISYGLGGPVVTVAMISLALNLVLADGVVINEIFYENRGRSRRWGPTSSATATSST